MNKFKYILLAVLIMPAFQSCEIFDLDTPQPNTAVGPENFITNRQSAQAAVAGAYDALQDYAFDGWLSLPQYFSDETVFTGTFPTRLEFGNFNVQTSNTTMATVFTQYYVAINIANNILDVLPTAEDPTLADPAVVNSFLAEARMIRAISYFHLWQGWNEVPLITTPTRGVGEELNVPKATADEIIRQMGEDLDFAEANLGGSTLGLTPAAATALKARIALYQGNNQSAYDLATTVLGPDFDLTAFAYLEDVIFSVDYSSTDGNSYAFFYGAAEVGGRHSIEPSAKLIAAYEAGDIRKDLSVDVVTVPGTPFGIKYDNFAASSGAQDDPILLLRHAEQVLIAAEAAARLGNFGDANMWFNQVRARAGLGDLTLNAGNFEDLILQERFVELAMESGHRLWDLRRTGKALSVLGPLGYDACDNVWPLPQRDIDRNPNLVQNGCCNC